MPQSLQPEVLPGVQIGELLGRAAFDAEQLAHACGVATAWVIERVDAGVLQADGVDGAWRFDAVTLLRARRIVHLEKRFDADPQLAALTADLIEEVAKLRNALRSRGLRLP